MAQEAKDNSSSSLPSALKEELLMCGMCLTSFQAPPSIHIPKVLPCLR